MRTARPDTPHGAQVVKVIVTIAKRGRGTEDDPVRLVRSYWSLKGKLLAEDDVCASKPESDN